MDRFKIGIIGAETPQGLQLIKLLLAHPVTELVAVSALREEASLTGMPVSSEYPSLTGLCSLSFVPSAQVMSEADVVFCADPDADSEELAAFAIKNKCVFLDMGNAFRLRNEDEFRQRTGGSFVYPGLHEAAIYGEPELYREHMAGKVLVSVPVALAAAAHLALVPLLNEGLVETQGIVIDAKLPGSGESASSLYCADRRPEGRDTAVPEIEQVLSEAAGRTVHVTLTACRTGARRELLITCCARATLAANARTIGTALSGYYAQERFVRVLPSNGRCADASAVTGTNVCEISARFDEHTGMVVVCAALDSLIKGAAGQAVQCMNRILSMPEEIGLELMPHN